MLENATWCLALDIIKSPIQIGSVTLRNRLAMPPMVRMLPHVSQELVDTGGEVTDAVVEYYARRARAGAALIIVEATCVDPRGRVWKHGLNAYDDAFVPGLSRIADAIAREGAVPGIQLVHGGPQADPTLCGGSTVGPSAVAPSVGEAEPDELTSAEVLEIEERFVAACRRVVEAGFRFVELHAAHGYLLDSFISPIRNQRQDAFGGSLENRMRIIVDILLRARVELGSTAALGARISVFNHVADGFGEKELREMVRVLTAAGSDFVDLSVDRVLRPAFGTRLSMGQIARSVTNVPVIVAGGITSADAVRQALDEGHGDVVAIGRAMLSDPDFPARVLACSEEAAA